MIIGCLLAASSGLVYLASIAFVAAPATSVSIVVLGRILLALGESLIATGALGLTSPLAGALAGARGIASVYLAGAITVALALVIALRLLSDGPATMARADQGQ